MTNLVSLWVWDRSRLVLQVRCPEANKQLKHLKFLKRGPACGSNFYLRQYFLPKEKLKLVNNLLGVKLKIEP